jgi:hypothetical protein
MVLIYVSNIYASVLTMHDKMTVQTVQRKNSTQQLGKFCNVELRYLGL